METLSEVVPHNNSMVTISFDSDLLKPKTIKNEAKRKTKTASTKDNSHSNKDNRVIPIKACKHKSVKTMENISTLTSNIMLKYPKRKYLTHDKLYLYIELSSIQQEQLNSIANPNKVYECLLYNQLTYSIGDFLLVTDLEDCSICKLLRIIPQGGSNAAPSYWPTIEVQWYYKKKDINRVKNGLTSTRKYNSLSEYEVFKSQHKDVIYIESIICKCFVYTLDEYEALETLTPNTFFCRAGYDPAKQMLNPFFEKWEKACKCQLPLNPDQLYLSCEKCEKWYHPECCDIKEAEVNTVEFICFKCKSMP
jgi:hypothetical protein